MLLANDKIVSRLIYRTAEKHFSHREKKKNKTIHDVLLDFVGQIW